MTTGSFVVAVDVGTSAVRAALVDECGELLRSVRIGRRSKLGGELFDANALWADVEDALVDLDGRDQRVAALSVSAHIGTVAVDDSNAPVAPAGGWADSRGISHLQRLTSAELDRILSAAGRPAVTGGSLAVALDVQASGRTKCVSSLLSPKDFIVAQLTGVLATDTVDAAYTLVSDLRRAAWQTETLGALGLPTQWFPSQLAPHDIVAEVRPEAAERCRLPQGVPIVAGGPDGSVGVGLLLGTDKNAIADVAGTTDVIGMLTDDITDVPPGAVANPAIVPGLWTAGGATGLTGGAVADWRSLIGSVDEETLASVDPGSAGLRVIPAMSGERFPRWMARSRGAVLGRTAEHGAAELLRAAQEAASFTVREGMDLLDPARRKPINVAGGSTRSRSVAQLRADVLGRTIRVAENPDVTLLGAVGLGFVASGIVDDLDEARALLGVTFVDIVPRRESTERYDEIYSDWLAARDASTAYDLRPS